MKDFSILDIFRIIGRKLWLVLSVAVVLAVLAWSYCQVLAVPTYSASSSIIVLNGELQNQNSNTNKFQSSDLAASLSLPNTVIGVLNTTEMYKAVEARSVYDYTHEQLKGMFDFSLREDSIIIDVKITTTNPQHSVYLMNIFSDLAPSYFSNKMEGNAKLIVNEQAYKASQVSPRTTLTVVAAFMVGAFLVSAVLVIYNMLDQTIKGEESITAQYNVPLLGMVPDFDSYQKGSKGVNIDA